MLDSNEWRSLSAFRDPRTWKWQVIIDIYNFSPCFLDVNQSTSDKCANFIGFHLWNVASRSSHFLVDQREVWLCQKSETRRDCARSAIETLNRLKNRWAALVCKQRLVSQERGTGREGEREGERHARTNGDAAPKGISRQANYISNFHYPRCCLYS